MHEAVTNGAYDVNRIREDFPDPRHAGLRQAARLSRQRRLGAKAEGGARPPPARLHRRIRQCASRPALPRQRRDRSLRGRARESPRLPQRGAHGRDHLHPQRHRGHQPGRLHVRARAHQGRRRDRALDHGAPFQHRALAFPARAPGRGDQVGAGRRGRQFPDRRIREAALAAHQDGRDHPHVEHARHPGAGERGGAPRPCPRHSGAPGRRPGRRPSRRRRAGHRLRFLCRHRPQALRADRHRRALRQARASRGHAAVQRRRRDDPRSVRGPHHLRRAAA